MTPLDSRFLKTFLTRIESRVPYMYAILRHLSPEYFYIFRFNDIANEIDGLDDPENNTYTLTEFLLAADSFHPKSTSGCFSQRARRGSAKSGSASTATGCVSVCVNTRHPGYWLTCSTDCWTATARSVCARSGRSS